ncbi:hypothetical protein XCV4329 [Xanthomonas euvesicatoria pv. vesicatoria str. 85-10]|uniref:Uncharacterized protein n=1 Tax=Xanthomonas euvesicatoria pv. vesicatoria (strain 85-10) TaxID=316273 RepID=Q3BMF3_XANE5|nr:hypothetical protein XCV4329 [Xanthomonas euvesicatoria pv. vesicatoria str. 85-10]
MASSASLQRAAFFSRSCGSANIFWLDADGSRADASVAGAMRAAQRVRGHGLCADADVPV